MKITSSVIKKINDYYKRPCEFNEYGQIVYLDNNYPVGYIAEGDWEGWLVDTTPDTDTLVKYLGENK